MPPRDVAGAQVDALHRGRGHPDLVLRPRPGQEVERLRIELARQVRPAPVRVRPHHRSRDVPERPQDPVGVEADDRVDRALELGDDGGLGRGIARPRRIETLVEPGDDQAHRLRVRGERVGEVRVGEAHAGLAEILTERAHDHDVARGEAGAEHQPVQLVVLDRARPHPEEDVGHARLHRGIAERVADLGAHTERVDPPCDAIRGFDSVRMLVDHGDAEVLEQGHDVRQHQRAAGAVQLDARHPAHWRFQPDLQTAGGVERLEDGDVGDRIVGRDVELVRGREGAHPAPVRLDARLLTLDLHEGVVQVVDPGPHLRRQLCLESEHVDLGCAVGRADDDVQSRHHRLGDQRGEVDVVAAERPPERVHHLHAGEGRVPVAREVDEARHEAAALVAADEEAHPPSEAHAHDAGGDLCQLVDVEAEQLVARVRLEHVCERARVVAGGREARPVHHLGDLAAEQWDALGRLAVGVLGVETQKAGLAHRGAVGVENPDADRVEWDVAVDGGTLQRFREREQPPVRGIGGLVLAEQCAVPGHPELRPRHHVAVDAHFGRGDECEVVVGEPGEEGRDLGHVGGVGVRRWLLLERTGALGDPIVHRVPVADRREHVVDHRAHLEVQSTQHHRIGLAVDLEVEV